MNALIPSITCQKNKRHNIFRVKEDLAFKSLSSSNELPGNLIVSSKKIDIF